MNNDPRLIPARPDLAAAHLKGRIGAKKFAKAKRLAVAVPAAPLSCQPDPASGLDTQLLYGEAFDAYESNADWAWGQAVMDSYVGYVPRACLEPVTGKPTHRISALMSHVYPARDIKSPPIGQLSYGAQLRARKVAQGFLELRDGGFVPAPHVTPIHEHAQDWVSEAERFIGVPYLWGGRSSAGIDCSGLIQLALQSIGVAAPRDTDLQAAELGISVPAGERATRGDLIFWKGHVGVMLNGTRMLHANASHMAVTAEPFIEARNRIRIMGDGPVTRHARIDMKRSTRSFRIAV